MGRELVSQSKDIDKLKALIVNKKIIPFVGAGVSMAVKDKEGNSLFFSWSNLLEKLAENSLEEQSIKYIKAGLDIPEPNYLNIADEIERLSRGSFLEHLKELVDIDYNSIDESSNILAKNIWNLNSNLIITTNYDKVLESASTDKNMVSWDIESKIEQSKVLTDNDTKKPTVWHLHGMVDKPENIILTTASYNELYTTTVQDSKYKATLETLRTLINTRPFLFIGFSLDDAFFVEQVERISKIFDNFGTNKHYVLLKEGADTSKLPSSIISIFYENRGVPLENLVNELSSLEVLEDSISKLSIKVDNNETPILKNPFNVPFESKQDGAIGIETKLKEVYTALQDPKSHKVNIGQVATFQGMGGLGKTQLAVEYAHRYKDEYEGVVWLTVDQDIDRQLVELAEYMGIVAKDVNAQAKLDIAKKNYANLENMLLIYDNIENYDDEVKELIPKANNNKILITSRNDVGGFTPIELATLSKENSFALLKHESHKEIQSNELESVNALIKELDGLPLAIEMAGAYMQTAELDWNDYWQLFQKQKVSFLEKSTIRGSGTNHDSNIGATLAIGEELFTKTPLLKEIIHLLAFGASEPISKELLSKMLDVEGFEIAEAIQEGTKLKYIKKEDENGIILYTLHRLVREVWKSQQIFDEVYAEKVSKNLASYMKEIKDEFLNFDKLEMASFQAKVWIEHIKDIKIKAVLLTYAVYPEYFMGEYKKALQSVEDAYKLLKDTINSDEYAEVLNSKGFLLHSLGDTNKALPYYEEALEMSIKLYPEQNHPDIASSLNNMGSVLKALGDAKKALPYCKEALEMRSKLYSEQNHPDIANSLNNMGSVLSSLGDVKNTLPYYEEALEMSRKLYSEQNHPDIANSLNNIGYILNSLGDAKKALLYCKEALKMRKELYPEQNHPDIASSLNNMGYFLNSLGDAKKALPYYEEALEMRKELYLEQNHPDIATSLNNMGYVLQALGDTNKALHYYEEALEMRSKLYPEQNHPDIANSLNNIGGILQALGDAKKALPYCKKALEMRSKLYSEQNHPDIASSLNNMGSTLVKFKKCKQAKEYLIQAKIMMEELGYDSEKLIIINTHLKNVEQIVKKEQKLPFKKKGRYCIDG